MDGRANTAPEIAIETAHVPRQDENLDIIYINEEVNREEWHTFEVGKTRFSDEALRQAG